MKGHKWKSLNLIHQRECFPYGDIIEVTEQMTGAY